MTSASAEMTLALGQAAFRTHQQAIARGFVDQIEDAYTAASMRPCAPDWLVYI